MAGLAAAAAAINIAFFFAVVVSGSQNDLPDKRPIVTGKDSDGFGVAIHQIWIFTLCADT